MSGIPGYGPVIPGGKTNPDAHFAACVRVAPALHTAPMRIIDPAIMLAAMATVRVAQPPQPKRAHRVPFAPLSPPALTLVSGSVSRAA
jgi:hypothetical protein